MKAQSKNFRFMILAVLSGISALLYGCMTPQQQLHEDAAKGSVAAQGTLSEAYLWGYWGRVDYEQAFSWASEAERQNNPQAFFTLGYIYDNGLGNAAPDHAKALEYYRKALPGLEKSADEGNACALFDLGTAYELGLGVGKDYARAYRYYRQSAARVFTPAVNNIAVLYRDGLGVEKDELTAKRYFLKAAQKNYPPAQYNLAALYYGQGKFEPALKWFEDAVRAEYPPAMEGLGLMYLQGSGIKQDMAKAEELFRRAAAAGCSRAQFRLAKMLLSQKNPEDAEKWLLKAVERDYPLAMVYLAKMYSREQPVKAMILYDLAGKHGVEKLDPAIAALDAATGLYLPVRLAWRDITRGEDFLKADSAMLRIIRGFRAGMDSGSRQVFIRELEQAPEGFYLCFDWYPISKNNLPLEWAGEIFKANHAKFSGSAAYWLAYAACATLAGQGAPAMYAAEQLKQAAGQEKNPKNQKELLDLSAVIKCSALIVLGCETDAYNSLFAYGKIDASPGITDYINHWARPALKNRKKFSVATGLAESSLAEFTGIPARQDIYDPQTGKNTLDEPKISAPAIKMPNTEK